MPTATLLLGEIGEGFRDRGSGADGVGSVCLRERVQRETEGGEERGRRGEEGWGGEGVRGDGFDVVVRLVN